jgi:hypothetical protein
LHAAVFAEPAVQGQERDIELRLRNFSQRIRAAAEHHFAHVVAQAGQSANHRLP